VHALSVGERQRVEILRCLLQGPRLLILDEPTSVLTPQAVLALFVTLRRLAAEGVSILTISHKLDEIRALCDVATVLRDGRVSGTALPRSETNASLARLMIGADLPACRLRPRPAGEVRLALQNLCLTSADPFGTSLQGIDLEVRAGELVGIAGVSGNGQGELLGVLSGETQGACPGALRLWDRDMAGLGAAARRRAGLRYVPEERLGRGTVPEMDLTENCVLTGAGNGLVRRGLVQRDAARRCAREIIARFAVKAPGERALAASLSGGNLQKFIVGREVGFGPEVLLVAQPTWGVDVGAALGIRQALIDLRDAGVAVLVVSEELDELFAICDRIAVLARGRLSPALPRAAWTAESIGVAMSGDFTALPVTGVAAIGGGRDAPVAP
jgi:simple sugar transport system ATP-binding protein